MRPFSGFGPKARPTGRIVQSLAAGCLATGRRSLLAAPGVSLPVGASLLAAPEVWPLFGVVLSVKPRVLLPVVLRPLPRSVPERPLALLPPEDTGRRSQATNVTNYRPSASCTEIARTTASQARSASRYAKWRLSWGPAYAETAKRGPRWQRRAVREKCTQRDLRARAVGRQPGDNWWWRPVGDSNPCYRRERPASWATRRTGRSVPAKRADSYSLGARKGSRLIATCLSAIAA